MLQVQNNLKMNRINSNKNQKIKNSESFSRNNQQKSPLKKMTHQTLRREENHNNLDNKFSSNIVFKDKFKSKKIIRAISPVHQISPKRIKSPNPMMNFDTNFKVKSAQSISRVSTY